MPSADGWVTCCPSQLVPKPITSPWMCAPRRRARSSSSSTSVPAPSATTRPSRSASNGREPSPGRSLKCRDVAYRMSNTAAWVKCISSAPPHNMMSSWPDADRLEAVADRVAGAGAGGAGRDHAPLDAEEVRQVDDAGVAHELEVAGRRDAAHAVAREQRAAELFLRRRRSVGGAVGEPDVRYRPQILVEARVHERALGRVGREQRHPAHAPRLLARVAVERDVLGDARQPRGQALDLGPLGHRDDAVPALAQRRDRGRQIVAERRGEADAR